MSESQAEFHDRLAQIYRKQAKTGRIARKSVSIDRNGYVIVRGAGRRRSIPWTGLLMVVTTFFLIKGAMMAQWGPDFSSVRVARLSSGTPIEQVAAWTMRPDPVSQWVATQVKTYF
ncbi:MULTISPECIES: hypothetical protein [unclassified Shimia]|uniref:hypothetical protein n=1 Tax=unclassified Shimia TaxID=2630038 RepID=UPI0031042A95